MRHVIIGNSAAAISAIEAIRERDKESEVMIISDEPCHAYSRVFLPKYIAGEAKFDNMLIREYGFYNDMVVTALLGQTVEEVTAKSSEVRLKSGGRIPYDNLLIATGASPSMPSIPGIDKQGVRALRTFDDACQITQFLNGTNSVAIIGAGLVGIKAAEALIERGVDVTIVEYLGHVLPQAIDSVGASIIQKRMESRGVRFFLNSTAKEIYGARFVQGVELVSGEQIEAGIVIAATGVKPNTGMLINTGIEIGYGVKVNACQRTNIVNIFAAGDVVESHDLVKERDSLNQTWPNAVVQGRVAGTNMAGGRAKYEGGVALNLGTFFGVDIASIGEINPKGDFYHEATRLTEYDSYRKIVTREGRIVGALLIGEVGDIGVLYSLICQKREVTDVLDYIERGKFSFAHVMASLVGLAA